MADQTRIDRLIRFMLKKVTKAVYEFGMIEDGDRIAVALSGGKDSFSLLEILRYRRRFVREKYAVCAFTSSAICAARTGSPGRRRWSRG